MAAGERSALTARCVAYRGHARVEPDHFAGAIGGIALARIVASYVTDVQMPGILPILGASALLVVAAILASLMPAARASRVDVVQALRSE